MPSRRRRIHRVIRRLSWVLGALSAFVGGIGFAAVLVAWPEAFLVSSNAGGTGDNVGQSGPSILGVILWLVATAICFLLGFALARILGWLVIAAVPHSESTEEKLTHETGRDVSP